VEYLINKNQKIRTTIAFIILYKKIQEKFLGSFRSFKFIVKNHINKIVKSVIHNVAIDVSFSVP